MLKTHSKVFAGFFASILLFGLGLGLNNTHQAVETKASNVTNIANFYDSTKISSTSGADVNLAYVQGKFDSNGSTLITALTKSGTVQYGKNGGLTLGAGSAVGSMTLTIGSSLKVSSVTVVGTIYDTGSTILLNAATGTGALNAKGTLIANCASSLVWNFTTGNEPTSLILASSAKRATIYTLSITYGTETLKTLSSIEVTTPPTKVNYYVGESFDKTGMVVKATYSDTSTNLNYTNYTFSPAGALSAGTQNITITSTDLATVSTTQQIVVTERVLNSISITTPPTKVNYYTGDTFDKTGMVVKATYSDASTNLNYTNYTFSPAGALSAGTQNITITSTDLATVSTTQQIVVSERTLSSIAITTTPTKTSFAIGQALDLTGLVVTGTYSAGPTSDVTSLCTVSPAAGYVFVAEDVGTKVITISLSPAESISFSVSVANATVYTLTFASTVDGTTALTASTISTYLTGDGSKMTFSKISNIFNGKENSLKFGGSSTAGELGFTLPTGMYASNAIITMKSYSDSDNPSVSVNNGTAISLTTTFAEYTFNFTPFANSISILSKVSSKGRFYASKIELTAQNDSASILAGFVMNAADSGLDTGACETTFPQAKVRFLSLSASEKTLFSVPQEDELITITNARARYLAWATNLGQRPWEEGAASSHLSFAIGDNANLSMTVVVAIFGLSAITGCFYLFKKRSIKQ